MDIKYFANTSLTMEPEVSEWKHGISSILSLIDNRGATAEPGSMGGEALLETKAARA